MKIALMIFLGLTLAPAAFASDCPLRYSEIFTGVAIGEPAKADFLATLRARGFTDTGDGAASFELRWGVLMKRRPFGLWAEVPHPFVSIRRDGKEVYRTELGSSKKSRTREAILARLARAIPECDSLLEQNE